MLSNKTILVIDDDRDLCGLLQIVLNRLQFLTEFAHTIDTGLVRVVDVKPFLILLNHNLPDGKGLHIITVIKEKHMCKIVLMSADPASSIKSTALEKGAHAFLEKPFTISQVRDIIMEVA